MNEPAESELSSCCTNRPDRTPSSVTMAFFNVGTFPSKCGQSCFTSLPVPCDTVLPPCGQWFTHDTTLYSICYRGRKRFFQTKDETIDQTMDQTKDRTKDSKWMEILNLYFWNFVQLIRYSLIIIICFYFYLIVIISSISIIIYELQWKLKI